MNGTCNESFVHFVVVYSLSVCTGSCVIRGFSGCCIDFDFDSCVGGCSTNGRVCYCDQVCHQIGDCCPDVLEIGCLPSGLLKTHIVCKILYILYCQLSIQEMMDLVALEVDL